MSQTVFEFLTLALLAGLVAALGFKSFPFGKKVRNYAVTLKHNEGSFIGLCIEKHWDSWTFEDIRVTPTNPGAAVQLAAPGKLHVPKRNILYYQEIANAAQ